VNEKRGTQLGLSSEDLRDAGQISETPDTWRVYEKQWIVVFTEGQNLAGEEATQTCEEYFQHTYLGRREGQRRLHDGDWQIVAHPLLPHRRRLEVRIWTLLREAKEESEVQALLGSPDRELVGRHTRAEAQLLNYGKSLVKEES